MSSSLERRVADWMSSRTNAPLFRIAESPLGRGNPGGLARESFETEGFAGEVARLDR